MHVFVVSMDSKTGADIAACGEFFARSARASASHNLARVMKDAGIADDEIEARGPDGKVRYRVKSLYAFAKYTVLSEPTIRRAVWKPYTGWGRDVGSDEGEEV